MDVITYPGPALKQPAYDIDPATDETLPELVKAMAEAMYAAPGIGLAATQVGVMKRVIVYDLGDDEEPRPVALCNPRIVSTSEDTVIEEEGCLSLPGIVVPVERFSTVTCEAQSLTGERLTIDAEGLLARLLQHEIDHLDGVVIIDRATPEERRAALRRYREAVDAGAKPGQTSI